MAARGKGKASGKPWRGRLRSEITVFFALTVTLIFALLLTVLESARTQGARLYLTIAANSSVDSLFSQYHRKLWDKYRLLGLEHYAEEQLTDEMKGFFDPYLAADNWFPMKTSAVEIEELRLLTEEDGEYFEKEVLDYMQYGIAAAVWDLADAESFLRDLKEGNAVSGTADLYDGHAREAARLEESLEKISDCLESQRNGAEAAAAQLEAGNGDGFIREARETIRKLKGVPGLVRQYEQNADRLAEGLERSGQKAEEKGEDISPEVLEALQEDIREYESYVSADGERRREITGFPARAQADIELLESLIEDAEEVQDYIDHWEPEDEDDELDEDELWEPLRRRMRDYDRIPMESSCGLQDKETEHKLENISGFLSSNLLKLVLPEGASVSTEPLKLEESPTSLWYSGVDGCRLTLAESIYMAEYMLRMTDYFGRGSYDTERKQRGSGRLETEYILYGKDTDTANLQETVTRLTAIRTGLDLAYLYTDSEKRAEARTLALQITGALGLTPLTAVMVFFIMSVWALAQAVCDVRDLLAGRRVPVMHDRDSFYLTLTGLLELASGKLKEQPDSEGRGLMYADWLRILLLAGRDNAQEFRCMDMIQMAMRAGQKDLRLDRMAVSLEADITVNAGHVFTLSGLVRGTGAPPEAGYSMHVGTAYSY